MEFRNNIPKLGMQLSKHQSQLKELEYSVALNANIMSLDGSLLTLTNEPSNLLCSRFKPGFKVVGVLPVNIEKKAIFFLVNPLTGESEIGEINNVTFTDTPDIETYCADCNSPTIEDKPLETQIPTELCTYTAIVNANCLNFSLDYPISALFRVTQDGITIFFASKNNPFRYINLWDIPKIQIGFDETNCNLPLYSTDLDCNAIKIVPDYGIPCVNTIDVVTGGNTQAGVYQFTAAYVKDIVQENLTSRVAVTDYFPVNNPIPIFDNSISRVETDYFTNKAIKFEIQNLDTRFNFINLVVLKTVNNVTTPYLIGTFPITSSVFSFTYTGNNNDDEIAIPIDEILRKRSVYTSARLVTEANDFLFWVDLEEQRPINLQPVVSKIPVKWVTIEQDENFYANPINNNYVSYLRDEVVPLGIDFLFSNGYATSVFPFVGRKPNSTDLEEILPSDPNYLPTNENCNIAERKYKWQFYNTGSITSLSECYQPYSIFDKFNKPCSINTYQIGEFSYWESALKYPNNPEVWEDLCGKPIRHFKFPDNCITPITDSPSSISTYTKNKIYPIGVKIDIQDIKFYLEQAVLKGLITEQEKLQITSFRIKRGNRVGNQSIIAKGILSSVGEVNLYTVDSNGNFNLTGELVYYPNWGFNDILLSPSGLGQKDEYINGYTNVGFNTGKYTFHSPETNFNNPLLPTELKTELIIGGKCTNQFSEVEKHSKYVLLKPGAYVLANSLAALEVVADAFIASSGSDTMTINQVLSLAISLTNSYFSYATDWLESIKGLGTPYNPAIFNTAIGNYTQHCCPSGTFQQIINTSFYLNSGNISYVDNSNEIRINNLNREKSVFLSVTNTFKTTLGCQIPDDNSKQNFNCTLNQPYTEKNIKTFYTSLKNYVPDQYGTIDQIEWIDTGYCGVIDWNNPNQDNSCEPIFGGDTYISRHYELKKFPFYVQDRVNGNINDDVQYQYLSNIGQPLYYFNTDDLLNATTTTIGLLEKIDDVFNPPNVSLECENSKNLIYYRGKLNLYNYSVSGFIVESSINLNFRYAENDTDKNFYPNILDLPSWRQQFKIPISTPNYYFYNNTYSKQNKENPFYILRDNFQQQLENQRVKHQNRVVYSAPNDFLTYSANDYFDFPLNDGRLVSIKGIEQQAVLVTQENAARVFNAYITVDTSLVKAQITEGNLFAQKPRQYYKTDLGFGGSTHSPIISTPFGHFYVDTQNPAIFRLSGDNLKDITEDSENKTVKQWFNANLPFNITKDFPEIDGLLIDNPYKDFGIALGWDNKFKRLFITKKDWKLKPEYKNIVVYKNGQFTVNNSTVNLSEKYFINKSWTIAYNPLYDQFVSFYSFLPNYYVSNETYFSTGIEDSVWNHLLTQKSYQVFYQNLHPFLVDYSTTNKYNNNILQSIRYQSDFRRFQGEYDWAVINNKTFNQALIYTQNQTSGILNLNVQEPNNLFQLTQYPKVNQFSTDILVKNVENYWTFNQFKDISLNNNQPIISYNNSPTIKELNPKAVSYKPKFESDALRNNYFNVRVANTIYSNYNILLHFNSSQQENSPI